MASTQPARNSRRKFSGTSTGDPVAADHVWYARLLERRHAVLLVAFASGLLLWAAGPPLNWWPLGWLAPLGWLMLIETARLPGRHPYRIIWLTSLVTWALIMQGIRLAHWANYFGLVALAFYLGIYLPLFIALARIARHRWRIPLMIAAPAVWVGVEVARGYGPLGFSMALLAHTQVTQLALIQIADICGPYSVSLVIMFVAAAVLRMLTMTRYAWSPWPAVSIVLALAAVLLYGQYRLSQANPARTKPALRVALIQGSIDTVFDDRQSTPEEILRQYHELTEQACARYQPLDLVMWPETMFPVLDLRCDDVETCWLQPPLDRSNVEDIQAAFDYLMRNGVQRINRTDTAGVAPAERRPTRWIFGVSTWQLGQHPPRRYNTAMLVDAQANIVDRYYKMHPVMFGEYVPFGETFPTLYNLFPLPNGLTPGTEPAAWEVGGLRLCPSICFENTMPHLMRWHVSELRRQGRPPDVLINLTNDGWFWGSSILDLQRDCAIFRAVELRRPFLIAANTGFSAWIDGCGRVLAQGPRRDTDTLLAEVVPDGRRSCYELWGDLPVLLCTLSCLILAVAHRWERRRARV